MSCKDNTLKFTPVDEKVIEGPPKYIPVEGISDFYCFGSLGANHKLYNCFWKGRIAAHN